MYLPFLTVTYERVLHLEGRTKEQVSVDVGRPPFT